MKRTYTILLIVLIILFGAALRFYRLNAVPLRGDEAFTVIHWMREPLVDTLANIATVDPQGPLNYAIYRAYALLMGSQEAVVRFLPALISILGIPVLYALAARLAGQRAGLLAALLWACHPFMIWHAQDARSYALWSVTNPLALWLGLRALTRGRRLDWVLYIFAAALSLYIYYLELFTIAALNLYVILSWAFPRLVRVRQLAPEANQRFSVGMHYLLPFFLSQLVIALLVAPWYLQERLLSGGGYTGTTLRFDLQRLFSSFMPTLVFGESIPFADLAPVVVVVLVAVGMLGLGWFRWRWALLLFLLLFVPLVALAVVSSRLNVFAPRYVLSVSVVIVLVVVVFSCYFWRRFAFFAVVLLLGGQFLSYLSYVNDYAKTRDWRSLAAYLQPRVSPSDYLVQSAADESFTFYCLQYTLSPDCDQKLPANPKQSQNEIISILTMRSTSHDSIWVVANPPSDWSNNAAVLDWLHAHMQSVREANIDGLPAHQFKMWDIMPDEVSSAQPVYPNGGSLALYANSAALIGIRGWIEPNDQLLVWLYWLPGSPTETPLKIFVHLLDPSGMLVAQDDQFPQDGRLNTTTWALTSALFRDIYHIPLPDGINENTLNGYSLAIGLYDPVTNQRFLLRDGSDAYLIPLDKFMG